MLPGSLVDCLLVPQEIELLDDDWIAHDLSLILSMTRKIALPMVIRSSSQATGSSSPSAAPDTVVVRPGRTIVVDPLANDSDPARRPLTITSVEPTTPGVTAAIVANQVHITVPEQPGTYGLLYEIANDVAGTASSFITLDVRTDAPFNAPVLSDSVVALSEILTHSEVVVDPLANAFWADGDVRTLTPRIVSGYPGSARVESGNKIRVTVGQKSQVIPFSVTHPEDPTIVSYAFVWVPGTDDARPQVKLGAKPISVASEKTVRININDYVTATGGKQVRLTSRDTVRATHANGDSLVVDDQTLEFTSEDLYFGPASLSFEVTDGAGVDDPNGRRAVIVLPLQVTPRDNQPPVLQDTQIDLEPDSTKQIDLVKITRYPYAKNVGELIFDHGIAASARHALAFGGNGRSVLFADPVDPVGPPAAFGFALTRHEFRERPGRAIVAPELVLARIRRIDDPGNVARSRKKKPPGPREVPGQFPHALGRSDMVLAPRLNVARRCDQIEVDRRAVDLQRVRQHQPIVAVEVFQIGLVPLGRQVGGVAVPVQQIERGIILAQQVVADDIVPDEVRPAQQVERRGHVATVEITVSHHAFEQLDLLVVDEGL